MFRNQRNMLKDLLENCQNQCKWASVLSPYMSKWLTHGWGHKPSGFILYLVLLFFTILPREKCTPCCSIYSAFVLRFMWFHKSKRSFPFIRMNVLYIVSAHPEYLTATMCSEAKNEAYTSRGCELHPDPEARAPLQDTMPSVCGKTAC